MPSGLPSPSPRFLCAQSHTRAPIRSISRRTYASSPPKSSASSSTQNPSDRIARIHARTPRFLRRFTTPLLNAPITHITSFILLHELTAIVPLFTLAGYFHYTHWLPPYISEGKWVSDGVEKFGNYFRRKGWLGTAEAEGNMGEDGSKSLGKRALWWGRGEGGVRIVVEFATAYAITKALLPARLAMSVWGTPWFARTVVVPMGRFARRAFGRGKKKDNAMPTKVDGSPGTGATDAATVVKDSSKAR